MTFPLSTARGIAQEIIESISPLCERVEIAGSIRRQKPYVKDIEIVAIPKFQTVETPIDLFNVKTEQVNLLHEYLKVSDLVEWIKPGTREVIPWHIKPDGKYWRGLLIGDLKLDLFLCQESNFGIIYAIRTGSAEFSAALVTYVRSRGFRVDKGHIWQGEKMLPVSDEKEVFKLFGLEYVEPPDRIDGRSLKVLKKEVVKI